MECAHDSDCSVTEACINRRCQHPCDAHNPCAQNAVCVNTNHVAECSCTDGYEGNGYVGCQPGKFSLLLSFISTKFAHNLYEFFLIYKYLNFFLSLKKNH